MPTDVCKDHCYCVMGCKNNAKAKNCPKIDECVGCQCLKGYNLRPNGRCGLYTPEHVCQTFKNHGKGNKDNQVTQSNQGNQNNQGNKGSGSSSQKDTKGSGKTGEIFIIMYINLAIYLPAKGAVYKQKTFQNSNKNLNWN